MATPSLLEAPSRSVLEAKERLLSQETQHSCGLRELRGGETGAW